MATYVPNPDAPRPPWAVELKDAETGARKHTWWVGGRLMALAPVPCGALLVGLVEAPGGLEALVWDTATGESKAGIGLPRAGERTRWAVSPGGGTLVAVDDDTATGYDLSTGVKRFTWRLADHGVLGGPAPPPDRPWGRVQAVAVSPDEKTLAVAAGDIFDKPGERTDELVLVEAATGRVIRRGRPSDPARGWLAFSADGTKLVGPRGVWEVATLREVRRFPAAPEVTAAGFSPDGKKVVTGHVNGTAVVWPVGPE